MTTPGGDVGDVWAELHIRTDEARKDLADALDDIGDDTEKHKKAGAKIGDSIGDGLEGSIRKSKPKIDKAVTDATAGLEEIPKERVRRVGRYFRDKATGELSLRYTLEEVARDALNDVRSGRTGKLLQQAGADAGGGFITAFRDAIGAGFNVSGKSPLSLLLIPVFGFIAHLIAALLPLLQSFGALLLTLPGLLASIGFQVGVVAVAFQGVGDAIKDAFAATNAKEIEKAIAGLTPSAQQFVRELVNMKDLFHDLKVLAQESFFKAFGPAELTRVLRALEPMLRSAIPKLAGAMGELFKNLSEVFNSPSFKQFVDKLMPATLRFLDKFGPAFVVFLTGLLDISTAMLPLLEFFGEKLSNLLIKIGEWFTNMSKDPETKKFIEDMKEMLVLSAYAVLAVIGFIGTFISEFTKAGGKEILVTLLEFIFLMTEFLKSGVGQAALRGLMLVIVVLSTIFVIMFVAIGLILAGIDAIITFLAFVGMKARELWGWMKKLADKVAEFFEGIEDKVKGVKQVFVDLKNTIINFFKNAGNWLYKSGQQIIQGLIDGILHKGPALGKAMVKGTVDRIGDTMPGSPAKVGPLSGSGYSYLRGQALIEDFAKGISSQGEMLGQTVSNTMGSIVFGPGSVRVDMQGQATPEQARITGTAVGMGALDAILQRNTMLAVRTL